MATFKDPRAIALCDHIRWMHGINPRNGWTACPLHADRLIQIGHRDYGTDPDITVQVDALAHALERLGLAVAIGYTVAVIAR